MKLNKKLLLKSSFISLAIATPVVVAVSYSTAFVDKTSSLNKKTIPPLIQNESTTSKVYSLESVNNLNSFFQSFLTKFNVEPLKLQALKAMDAASIAFIGYLESDGTKKEATSEQIKKSKQEFAKNIEIFKNNFDELFDMAISDPTSASNIISPIIRRYLEKPQLRKMANIVVEELTKKLKMVIDNVLDTVINLESPKQPVWFTDDIESKGTLTEFKSENVDTYNAIKTSIDDDLKQSLQSEQVRGAGSYNLLDHVGDINSFIKGFVPGIIGDTVFKIPEEIIQGNPWQIGIQKFAEKFENKPDDINVYQDKKTKKIYFKINEKTSELANNINTNLKLNEENLGSIFDDKFINEQVLQNIMLGKPIKLPTKIAEIKNLFSNKNLIYDTLNKMQALLEDFGKTLQLTELNLQMLASHLIGNNTQYYGGFEPNNDPSNIVYTPIKESFTSPQFNIYNYKNYRPYNKNVDTSNTLKVNLTIHKTFIFKITQNLSINVLDVIKNLTKDPFSNYTVGIFQIAQVLSKGMPDINKEFNL